MLIHNFVDFYVESIWANCLSSCRYQWVLGWTKLENIFVHSNHRLVQNNFTLHYKITIVKKSSQFSAMDVSVRTTMKGAAKCDKHCELQNSVNRQGLERILCFWDIPESMPASVSTLCCSNSCNPLRGTLFVISCASGRALSAFLRCSMDKALLRQPAY